MTAVAGFDEKSLVNEHRKSRRREVCEILFVIQLEPVRLVLPFDWLTTDHLVSGESTLHQVTHFSARSRIFLPLNPVLRGSILLPPRHPSVFARMARWQLGVSVLRLRCGTHVIHQPPTDNLVELTERLIMFYVDISRCYKNIEILNVA